MPDELARDKASMPDEFVGDKVFIPGEFVGDKVSIPGKFVGDKIPTAIEKKEIQAIGTGSCGLTKGATAASDSDGFLRFS